MIVKRLMKYCAVDGRYSQEAEKLEEAGWSFLGHYQGKVIFVQIDDAIDQTEVSESVNVLMEQTLVEERAWRAKAKPLLQQVADGPVAYREQPKEWFCVHCAETEPCQWGDKKTTYEIDRAREALRHAANCPVTLARALLAESETPHE